MPSMICEPGDVAQACNCPAGLKGRRCYHRAAVAILTAA